MDTEIARYIQIFGSFLGGVALFVFFIYWGKYLKSNKKK